MDKLELTLVELYQIIGELEVARRKHTQIIEQLQREKSHDDPVDRGSPGTSETA